jgi:hypothetical protein
VAHRVARETKQQNRRAEKRVFPQQERQSSPMENFGNNSNPKSSIGKLWVFFPGFGNQTLFQFWWSQKKVFKKIIFKNFSFNSRIEFVT